MAGLHVVTGRQWNNDDVNSGAIGTISRFKKEGDSLEIDVSWENGTSSHVTFPANLELLDTNALGVSHPSTVCDICKEVNICGFLWNCVAPACNKSLCSKCYHGDKHNLRHAFERVDISGSSGVQMGKRQNYTRMKLSGPRRYNGRPYYIDHLPSIWEWRDVNILRDRLFSEVDPVYGTEFSATGRIGGTVAKQLDQHPEAHYENKETDIERKSLQIASENTYENTAAHAVSSPYTNDAVSGTGHTNSLTPTGIGDNPYIIDEASSKGVTYDELTGGNSTIGPALIEEEVYDELEEAPATKSGKAKEKGKEKGSFMKKLFKKKKEKNATVEETVPADSDDYVVPISPGSDPDNIYDSLQEGPPVPEGDKNATPEIDLPTTVTIVQSYQPRAGNPDELTVRVGDVVRGVVRGEDGWLKGTLAGRTGYFPDITVQKTDVAKAPASITQRALPAIPNQGTSKSQPSKRASLPVMPTENRDKAQVKEPVAGGALATRTTARTLPLPATPTERRTSDDVPGPTLAEARLKFGEAAKVDKIERVKPKPTFNRADKVRITKTIDEVKRLQVGHGGCLDTIEEVLGKVGIVTDVHKTGDVFVKFDSLCTRLNPEVLSAGDAAGSKPMRRPLSMQLQGRLNMMVNRENPDDNTH